MARAVLIVALAAGCSTAPPVSPSTELSTPAPASDPAPTTSASVQPGALTRIGALMTPRAGHTTTLLPDGRVLVAGGCTEDSCEGVTAATEILDPATGQSQAGPDMSLPRVGHAAVSLQDGQVLLIGGFTTGGVTDSTDIFDPVTGEISQGPVMHGRRSDPVVVQLEDGSILVAGGFDGRASIESAELFDPASTAFRPTGSLASARSSHAGALLGDGRVLVAGGGTGGASDEVLASAEVYDPATGTWMTAGDLTTRRHKLAAVALRDGSVLVAGGSDERDGFGRYASAELYAPETGTFTRIADMAAPRYKIAAALVPLPDGRVLVAGGAPAAELFDPDPGTFAIVPNADGANPDQSFATAVRLDDGSVIVMGGYDSNIRLTDQILLLQP